LPISKDDIQVKQRGDQVKISLRLQPSQQTLYVSNKISNQLIDYLSNEFCEDFIIELKDKEESDYIENLEEADASDFFTAPKRTIQVTEVQSYISYDKTDVATYIADAVFTRGEVYVCGVITGKREMLTKTGKTMFLIDFTDKTGRLTGKFFATEKRVDAVKLLKEGEGVIFKGEMGDYNGNPDFSIKSIGLCKFPEDFEPVRRAGKPVPGKYKKVFPCEIEDVTQLDMFTDANYVPDCLIGKTFVVFDIETTGLDNNNDRITEIGAVKIVDGKIVNGFTTLINPQKPIPKDIQDITGINDEMVADKPLFDAIIGDFYKYIDGAVLIAHNANFDVNFIKKFAEREGYYVENDYLDTMEIARKNILGLKNYKLNTICEHFGIQFLHHRAMSDAHATAKMFLEIIKLKKCLPN
jgi:DNA polymerase III epsilon subunit family exonuclease